MRKIDLVLLLKYRHQHQSLRKEKLHKASFAAARTLLAIIAVLVVSSGLFAGYIYSKVANQLPSLDALPALLDPKSGELLQPSRIMDRENYTTLLILENPGIERTYLKVDPQAEKHFGPQLIRAVVSKLDPSFWQSSGVTKTNWFSPDPSTIAERIVNDLLLWDEPASQYRPLRMRLLASQLVNRFGRTQVLEWYLNSAYFGHLAVGAESAAQLYFQKSAQDLTLAESALLAVLIDSPALNPLDAPSAVLDLQKQFLGKMAESQVITTEEFSAAVREKLNLRESIDPPASFAGGFTTQVLQQLGNEFGQERLVRGGLRVISSLDMTLQDQLTCTNRIQLNRLESNSSGFAPDTSECRAALQLPTQVFSPVDITDLAEAGLIMDPKNGEILAYSEPVTLDGKRLPDNGFDPGTLLSPIAALAGFARGFSPASLTWDIPSSDSTIAETQKNPDGTYHGPVSIRTAIANDYPVPIAGIVDQIEPSTVWHLASVLGMTSFENVQNSSGYLFGGSKTTLSQIAAAYATLANSGIRSGYLDANNQIRPTFIYQVVTESGRILIDQQKPSTSIVVSAPLSYLINQVLSDESARWPSLGYPNALEIGQPVAARTGTNEAKNQVWTVGYTPQRLVLVWLGSQKAEGAIGLDPRMAAGTWHALIKTALEGLDAQSWVAPEGISTVKVCVPSGMLPSVDCPNTMNEIFLNGNEPTIQDTLYQKIKVNRETGQRATVFTPPDLIDEKVFINVPPQAISWAKSTGFPVAPTGYDAIASIEQNPHVSISSPILFTAVAGKVTIQGTADIDGFANYSVQVGEGINPDSWLQIGSTATRAVTKGELVVWDSTGLSGLYAIRLNVVTKDQHIQTAIIQVTVDNAPPVVRITYPQDGQTISQVRGSVILMANVQDEVGISKVEWQVDGKLVETQNLSPFIYSLQNTVGKHTLQVTAWDTAGNKTQSSKIQFEIIK